MKAGANRILSSLFGDGIKVNRDEANAAGYSCPAARNSALFLVNLSLNYLVNVEISADKKGSQQ